MRRVAQCIGHACLLRGRLLRPQFFVGWNCHPAPGTLPSDFRQITPAKPKQPPASNIHSGLSRVAKASTADTAVTRAAAQVRSEVSAKIRPLAPINPIERGT